MILQSERVELSECVSTCLKIVSKRIKKTQISVQYLSGLSGLLCLYLSERVCVRVQPAGGGECRGTAAASDSCVINIRTWEGGREEERVMGESNTKYRRLGGAVLLRITKQFPQHLQKVQKLRKIGVSVTLGKREAEKR